MEAKELLKAISATLMIVALTSIVVALFGSPMTSIISIVVGAVAAGISCSIAEDINKEINK